MHKLIQALTGALFEAEDRRLNQTINRLNQENKKLWDAHIDGFLYMGKFYKPTGGTLTLASPTQPKTPLDASLVEAMELHLKDVQIVRDEQVLISQMLLHLLTPCRSDQDMRDALPECLISCVSGLSSMQRTREAGYTLQDNPRHLRQYAKILPKMAVYSAARMLY